MATIINSSGTASTVKRPGETAQAAPVRSDGGGVTRGGGGSTVTVKSVTGVNPNVKTPVAVDPAPATNVTNPATENPKPVKTPNADTLAAAQKYLNDYNADREEKIKSLYAANIAAQNAQQQTAYDANAAALKAAYDANLGAQQAAYDANKGSLKTNYDDTLYSIKNAYDKNANAIQSAYDNDLNNINLTYDKNTGILKTAYDKNVGDITTAYDKNTGILKTNYDENLGNLYTQLASNTGDLKTAYEKNLASLQNAYEQNMSDALAMYEKISPQYQQSMNALAADYERQRQNANMQAAVSGLNSGAGSQMALAQGSAYQTNQANLARSENEALNEANRGIYDLSRTFTNNSNILETEYNNNLQNLNTQYNNNVATINQKYNNEKANLEKELQNVLKTLSTEYNNNQANLDTEKANKLSALATSLSNQLKNLEIDNQNQLAALDAHYNNELANMDIANQNAIANLGTKYQNDFAAMQQNYQNQIAQAAANNDYQMAAALLDEYGAQYDRVMQQAAQLADYGDFSLYAGIYGVDAAQQMEQIWTAQNPDLAYNLGKMTAEEYFNMTGRYPNGYSGSYGAYGAPIGSIMGQKYNPKTGQMAPITKAGNVYSWRGGGGYDKAYRGPAGHYDGYGNFVTDDGSHIWGSAKYEQDAGQGVYGQQMTQAQKDWYAENR